MIPERKQKSKSARAVKWFLAHLIGIVVGALIFLALPLMQFVGNMKKKELTVREVTTTEPPPPPPIMDEPPPDEPPPPEDQPQMDDVPQNLSLGALELSLNPGSGGSGAKILSDALSQAVANRAGDAFSLNDLDQKPRPVYQVPPKYPAALKRQGISGVVKIELTVDASGKVINPTVIETPDPAFNSPALEAIKQWRFEPGTRGGSKVSFKLRVPLRFAAS